MSEATSKPVAEPVPERASRQRQRQRLIDACISALHIYGPSHTTVEKVVALADMSPGIVRFYFESKAAMLVASLEFLALEFEQRVQLPVARLKETPVRALELLVELYLDADIASPRKVSVWYSFWGEASSRQEYLEICGKKDDDFEALVRELSERMIEHSGQRDLDADGVALGLMGALEVLWQGIAFQREANIDRRAAKRRTMNYLRSVFPGQFAPPAAAGAATLPREAEARFALLPGAPTRLPAWAYSNAALLSIEREQLFRAAWQMAGHASELPAAGAYLSIDLPTERALVLRDQSGRIRAFHNTCRHRPHALLTARSGTLAGSIECSVHGLQYGYDGTLRHGETPGDLSALELTHRSGLLLVRSTDGAATRGEPAGSWSGLEMLDEFETCNSAASGSAQQFEVAADWKLMVEQWLESSVPQRAVGTLAGLVHAPLIELEAASGVVEWRAGLNEDAPGWTAGHYTRLARFTDRPYWQRLFVPPNHLLELRPDGVLVLQIIPEAPGRCRLRRFDLRKRDATRSERALFYLAQRLIAAALRQDIALACSIQSGLAGPDHAATEAGPIPHALAVFRRSVFALLQRVDVAAS